MVWKIYSDPEAMIENISMLIHLYIGHGLHIWYNNMWNILHSIDKAGEININIALPYYSIRKLAFFYFMIWCAIRNVKHFLRVFVFSSLRPYFSLKGYFLLSLISNERFKKQCSASQCWEWISKTGAMWGPTGGPGTLAVSRRIWVLLIVSLQTPWSW